MVETSKNGCLLSQNLPSNNNSGDTIACLNSEGLVEIIDIYSGAVLSVQSSKDDLLKSKKEKMVQVLQPDGSLIYLEPGVNQEKYAGRPSKWKYSETLIEIIAQKLMEGQRLTAICKEPGMPPFAVLARWRRQFPNCNERLMQARSDYAEVLREEVVEQAMGENTYIDKETGKEIVIPPTTEWIAQRKMRITALQWAASVDSPDRFGSKTKVIGENTTTVHLIVDTGIRRPEDIEVTPKQISGEIFDGNHQDSVENIASAGLNGTGDPSAIDGDIE